MVICCLYFQNLHSFNLEACSSVSGSGESGARFGTTIADLGDVDGDGFKGIQLLLFI